MTTTEQTEANFAALETGEVESQRFGDFGSMSAQEDFRYRLLLKLAADVSPRRLELAIMAVHVGMEETRERLARARRTA